MKILFRTILLFFFCGLSSFSLIAQTKRSVNSEAIFEPGPSSRDPGSSEVDVKKPKRSKKTFGKKSFNQKMDQKVEEYEERMKDNEKKYKKMEKEMKKPQYSDPMYFGHKHKPKKRPPGKQKFCKVCGMRH